MRVIFDVGHPAQVHFYKNAAKILQMRGHSVLFSARDKDVLIDILAKNHLPYRQISEQKSGFIGLSIELLQRLKNLHRVAREFRPDLICGPGETVALVGKALRIPVILFNDSEPVPLNKYLTYPFVDVICTPTSFRDHLGPKHIRYNGLKEIAYLHPKHFTPDEQVLKELGLTKNDPFVLLRFVSWRAWHDTGHHGLQDKEGIVHELEKYGRVFISSEAELPPSLQRYRINISPEKLHDVLSYAKLLFCDSQTMATEAAVLGTPAVRCNSFVGKNDMGNFIELEETYDLLYNFTDSEAALGKAVEILQDPVSKENWRIKREKLLADKIDVTAFMVWLIENYPQSFTEMKEHPEVQRSCAPVPGDAS